MRSYLILGLSVIMLVSVVMAQAPQIEWQTTFGGEAHDWARSVAEIEGEGYVIAGRYYTEPYGGGEDEVYVVKTDLDGGLVWENTYGGDYSDFANCVLVTDSGGFIVCGNENSYPPTGTNIWLLSLDGGGNINWAEVYGGENTGEHTECMCRTLDGNYMIAGSNMDGWLFLKISPSGALLNQVSIDRPLSFREIAPTSDGGAIAVGGGATLFLVKLDSNGDTLWVHNYGGSYGSSVIQLEDGGYAAAGYKSYTNMGWDFRLLRLDADGEIIWDNHYGNQYDDEVYSLRQTPDGGFVMAGLMYPPSGTENHRVWVVRTDSSGDTLWTKAFGGDGSDLAFSVRPTADHGFIIAGKTNSFGAGGNDMYVVKLGPETSVNDDGVLPSVVSLKQNYPNPFNPETIIEFDLPYDSHVIIDIYDILGRKVSELVDEKRPKGNNRIVWNGTDSSGQRISNGIYLYRLEFEDYTETRKMIILK